MSRISLVRHPLLLLSFAFLLGACQMAPDDLAVAAQVLHRINREPALQTSQIRVQVIGGVVYLYGLVDTQREVFAVESAARATPVVTRVVNATAVNNPPF